MPPDTKSRVCREWGAPSNGSGSVRVGRGLSTCKAGSVTLGRVVAKRKNPHAAALGRLGGQKRGGERLSVQRKAGGAARAKKITAKQRSESARKAAKTPWERGEKT